MSSFSCDWSLSSRLCNVLSWHIENMLFEANLRRQILVLTSFMYEFSTKKTDQTNSNFQIVIFQEQDKSEKKKSLSIKKCLNIQYS